MQMNAYLNFQGECEAAFALYERCLGAQRGPIFRYGGTPAAGQVPPDWQDKIMHGSVTIAGQTLMAADVTPARYEAPVGFSLSLQVANAADAERIFADLSSGGNVVMPLEKTFWAERFGMLVDRFGVPWMINCEAAEQPSPE